MAFKYTAVTTRPDVNTPWFKDSNPTAYNEIIAWWQAQPGFVSGTWQQDPSNPAQFITEHTWANKAAWETAALLALDQDNNKLFQKYAITAGFRTNKTLLEV